MAHLSIDDDDFWGRNPPEMQAMYDAGAVKGLTSSVFLLGKREENPPIVAPLNMAPGFVLARHAHDCYRMEIIVRGSLTVDGRVLGVGSVMITAPGEIYGPHTAGAEGCTTFEICSDYEGAGRLMMENASGEMVTFNTLDPNQIEAIVERNIQLQDEARDALGSI